MPRLVQRQKYHTAVIALYTCKKEHLLSEEFRKKVPPSTASTWRKTDLSFYMGSEFQHIQNKSLEWYEMLHERKRLEKVLWTLARTWISLSGFFQPLIIKSKEYQEQIINEIQRLCSALPKKLALKIAGLSDPAFTYRLNKLKHACSASPFSLCLKKHPLQLSASEIRTMKSLLSDQRYACWPVSSIAHYARRSGELYIGLSTWYRYLPLLGIRRIVIRPEIKTKGIVTFVPNQYLHVDTTFYLLADSAKRAITFVSDNFSKAILGWSIHSRNCAENVKAALNMAMETIRKYYPQHICATLVADGGSENHAVTITELLEESEHPSITKLIALKDISFSNSPAEAIHKIMKRYLRYYDPKTDKALQECTRFAAEDYNFVRPHGSLNGVLPMEAYAQNIPDLDFTEEIKEAKTIRIDRNRKANCGKC